LASVAEDAGHEVAAVVLLDAGAPHLLRSARTLLLNELAGLFEISPSHLPTGAAPASDAEALDLLVKVLHSRRGIREIDTTDLQPFVDAYRWHLAVARKPWTFEGCRAEVFLLRARDETGWNDAPPDLGWSPVLGVRPTTLWTPGTHYDLISEERAPRLGLLLSALLLMTVNPTPLSIARATT
jgi:thioesterase domain-containing protein